MNRLVGICVVFAIALVCVRCAVDHNSASVQVQGIAAPSATCVYSAGGGFMASGLFDPLQPQGDFYQLAFQVRNNMLLATSDAATFGTLTNARDQGTGIDIVGFEGCWYQYQGDITKLGEQSSGALVDCATIPAQSGSLPTSIFVDAGQGTSIAGVNILDRAMLKSLFGDQFDINKIANDSGNYVGYIYDGVTGAFKFNPRLKDPGAVATRNPAWGDKYPETLQANLVIQMRGIYTMQSGSTGHTNWVSFPIEFCPSCRNDLCGQNVYVQCPVTCSNSGNPVSCPTDTFTCPSGNACGVFRPFYTTNTYTNWGVSGGCLPAQNVPGATFQCLTATFTGDPNCPTGATVP